MAECFDLLDTSLCYSSATGGRVRKEERAECFDTSTPLSAPPAIAQPCAAAQQPAEKVGGRNGGKAEMKKLVNKDFQGTDVLSEGLPKYVFLKHLDVFLKHFYPAS